MRSSWPLTRAAPSTQRRARGCSTAGLAEMFPNSPLAPEAAWRAADILWQIQKADASTRKSAKERDAYMRDQMDEEEMKRVIKYYPHTRQADFAAYALIENKLCGDWQGQPKCPEKESEYYEKYCRRKLRMAAHGAGALSGRVPPGGVVDMFAADGSDNKSNNAKAHAHELAAKLKDHFAQSDYCWRAAALGTKLDQGVPVLRHDRE